MPAISQTARATGTDPDCRNTVEGTIKMPDPITLPMTISVRSQVPSARRSEVTTSKGES